MADEGTRREGQETGPIAWRNAVSTRRADGTRREGPSPLTTGAEEMLFRTLFQISPAAISIATWEGVVLDVNPAMIELFGYTHDELARLSIADLYADPEDEARLRDGLRAAGVVRPHDAKLRTKDGRALLGVLTAAAQRVGNETLICIIVRDVTAERQRDRELAYFATHDPLTGLANRAALADRLELEIGRARRRGHGLAILSMDLHGLKQINAQAGHGGGDAALREVAGRLALTVRESDSLGRIGGDQFALVAPEVETADDAAVIAGRVIEALREPFLVEGREFPIAMNVGISLYPQDGSTGPELMRKADVALQRAKSRGPNSFAF